MRREKIVKMVRKSAITMTCMLLTVGCTGLQTKGVNESASGNKKGTTIISFQH